MSEQEENELICEKLLGWKRVIPKDQYCPPIRWKDQNGSRSTPTFTDWASRGLIIDALQKAWPASKQALQGIGGALVIGSLSERDVRDAALEYIRSLER